MVLSDPALSVALSAYADDVLLLSQDPEDLVWMEACQAVCSVSFSAWISWVKSSGLIVGDGWQVGSLPPALHTIQWGAGLLLYLGLYLSATDPSPRKMDRLGGQGV